MVVIILGVTGSGKTTIGKMLAAPLAWEFVDADSFHPPANVEKMSMDIPLDDADRLPWLHVIHSAMVQWITERKNMVLACSLLKRSYREMLPMGPDVKLVYLKGDLDLIQQRVRLRPGHFAKEGLLASQFALLEEPKENEAISLDINHSAEELVAELRGRLGLA